MSLRPIRTTIDVVSRYREVAPAHIMSAVRQRAVAWPRQEVCWIARRAGYGTMPAIGRALGLDHTTVLHGERAVERRMEACADYRQEMEHLLAATKASVGRGGPVVIPDEPPLAIARRVLDDAPTVTAHELRTLARAVVLHHLGKEA